MKVKELIEKLKEMPEDALVLTTGYEGGLKEICGPVSVEVFHKDVAWYYGDYWEADKDNLEYRLDEDEEPDIIQAVYLPRGGHR